MKFKGKKINWLALIRNVLLFTVIAAVLYGLFGPINPADYKNVTVKTNPVFTGGILEYESSTCRYVGENVRTDVIRKLVSTTDETLTPVTLTTDTISNPQGCKENVPRKVLIPANTPVGCYRLQINGLYYVFPIRMPISRDMSSQEFCIEQQPIDAQIRDLEEQLQNLQQQQGNAPNSSSGSVSSSGNGVSQTPQPSSGSGGNTSNNTTNNVTNNNDDGSTDNDDGALEQTGSGASGVVCGITFGLLCL